MSAVREEPCEGRHQPSRRPECHVVAIAPLFVHSLRLEDPKLHQEKADKVLSQGTATLRNIQLGRSARSSYRRVRPPGTSSPIQTYRIHVATIIRLRTRGIKVGTPLMNPVLRRSDDLESWGSPRRLQVRSWVISAIRAFATGIFNLSSPISPIAVDYFGYREDAVR